MNTTTQQKKDGISYLWSFLFVFGYAVFLSFHRQVESALQGLSGPVIETSSSALAILVILAGLAILFAGPLFAAKYAAKFLEKRSHQQ